jgi:hypothetical protein
MSLIYSKQQSHSQLRLLHFTVYATPFYVLSFLRRRFSTATCFGSLMNHLQAIYMWSLRKLLYPQRIRCFRFNLSFVIYDNMSFKFSYDLYSSPSIIRVVKSRRMRWAGNVARMGEKRNAYRLLVGKPEGTRPLGRPRRKWLNNIRMDLVQAGWGWCGLDWSGSG